MKVIARPGESAESLIRRFRFAVERDGILQEVQARRYFQKPSVVKQNNLRELRNKLRQNNRRQYHEI